MVIPHGGSLEGVSFEAIVRVQLWPSVQGQEGL
jgi:hypothetical protein